MYHFTLKTYSRRGKKKMIPAAAYRSCEKLYDDRYKQFSDFTNKIGIAYTEIILPSYAPPSFGNREVLWNTVESIENRKDSRLAREVEFALPRELTLPEQIELAKAFIVENFVSLGMCADLCIHHKNPKNPHAHVLLTDRPVNSEGFVEKKDPSWNDRNLIRTWRKSWELMLNKAYERKGLAKRVSCESYKTRGITDRKPTKHLGPRVLEYAKHKQPTDRILEHIEILVSDHERERLIKMLGINRKRERDRDRPFDRTR